GRAFFMKRQLPPVSRKVQYQSKKWCGVEFRAIRETIMNKQGHRVMFVRMDDGPVDGVFDTDGYVDGRIYSPAAVARFIHERVELNA
ncbi:MAG: hypothetical protein WD875_05295, partial [Pirellulales bacterium]